MQTQLLNAQLQPVTDTAQCKAVFVPEQNLTFLDFDAPRVNHIKAQELIDKLNTDKHLGHSDWTLPPLKALFAHAQHDRYDPAVDAQAMPLIKSDAYWTPVLDLSAPDRYALVAHFSHGTVTLWHRQDGDAQVLACRVGGPVVR